MKASSPDSHHGRLEVQLVFKFIVMAFMMILCFAENTKAVEKAFPFYPGEKLTFQVRWSFIPAGVVVIEVLPIETINGVKSYHFVMIAKTNPFIDLFCKVRDRIDAYTDIEMTHSILYKKQNEGKNKRNVVVNFNWEKREVLYSNFGKKRKPISILPGSFDPLSVFYAFRLHDLKENKETEIPVTDGKKCVLGKARVLKREKIKVASGTYDTYLVEPDLKHIGGVFKKSKGAKLEIWVTADTQRIPVKIKSKVIVGSFIAELTSAEKIGPTDPLLGNTLTAWDSFLPVRSILDIRAHQVFPVEVPQGKISDEHLRP